MSEQVQPRPLLPEVMSHDELVAEVRWLRAHHAALRHLSDLEGIDEDSARRRLGALERALAALPVGFMLLDAEDRIVFKNNRYIMFDQFGERDRPGTTFADFLRFGIELGNYPEALDDPETWFANRMRQHSLPRQRVVQAVSGDRFIQIEERRLEDGGTVGSYTDVTQLKRTEEALARALDAAEAASQAKSVFLANMSHELRTPLNAIIGFTELLLSDVGRRLDQAARDRYLSDVRFAALHLATIIADILDISRVETGQYEIEKAVLDAGEVGRGVLRMFEGQAQAAGVELTLDVPEAGAGLYADGRALRQMLINLVSNGLKHTPGGGRIALDVSATAAAVEVTVADTGIGIPAAELERVLEPFQRGSRRALRDAGGLGLGLALTRRLMQLHGGDLALSSTEGVGTTVTLRFPPAPAAPAG